MLMAVLTALQSCASFGTPTGGDPDEDPPVLDLIKSEKNEQTQFTKKSFELYFDEYIELKNVSKQLVVSPPLSYKPKIEARLKKLSFIFDEKEELKPNATYVINFGESIVDYRAGNALKNFTFVFSTGDQIDSLQLKGQIADAYEGKAVENILVALYDDLTDSVIVKNRPFYLAKTDKEGRFRLGNLKSDTFRMAAFEDLNLNLKYDEATERIGFLDSLIMLNDSSSTDFKLEISKSLTIPRYLKNVSTHRGITKLLFDSSPEKTNFITEPSNIFYFHYPQKDTLLLFGESTIDSTLLYIGDDTIVTYRDTSLSYPDEFNLIDQKFRKTLSRKDSLFFSFNHPIESLNQEFILVNDSLKIKKGLYFENNMLRIGYPFKQDSSYSITILPDAITDIFGNTLDTISTSFRILNDEDLGKISIQIDSLIAADQYIIKLESKKEKLAEIIHSDNNSFTLEKDFVAPGKYFITILEDVDKNGVWTPANYWEKRQAERFKVYELEDLRANWELEDVLIWNEKKSTNEASTK